MVGLVLLVDACRASWAKQQVEAWSGVRGGLLSAWLGSSGDQAAWDACFTKRLISLLERGVPKADHPRTVLVPQLLALDLEDLVAKACRYQAPRLGGYESHNPVLFVSRNRCASELAAELGLDGVTETLLLRLTEDYVAFAVDSVVPAVAASRVVAVIGGPGTGKSTLAAALRRPPTADVPLAVVHAVAFVAAASSVPDLARTLRGQLDTLQFFKEAARRYEAADAGRWNTLDFWQQQVTGPLSLFPQPVRLLLDGIDQLEGRPEQHAVLHALRTLINDPMLAHVSLLLTSRTVPPLQGIDATIPMPALDAATGHRYLASRHLDGDQNERLIALATGSWLVLKLAADVASRRDQRISETLEQLYTDLLDGVRAHHSSRVDAVLVVLAAAGPGPVLPFDLLARAIAQLGVPLSRAELQALLGDADLYAVLDRTRPGQVDEHLGLFHQTLVDHLLTGADSVAAHRALAAAIEELVPAFRHDPKTYRADQLFTYAFDAGPRHRWEAGQPELLAVELAQREDPVPRVNLARWTAWADRLRDALSPDHPDTLSTRHNIAYWTGEAGGAAQALRLFRELLPDQERVLGPDHPTTLVTRLNIAAWTEWAGDAAQALRLFRELLPDHERVLGPDHPETAKARKWVAYLQQRLEDREGR